MTRPALKLIERETPYVEEGSLWNAPDSEFHSLHFAISYPNSFRPQLPAFFIHRYSSEGDTVLDPFCGRGTTCLEASLLKREAMGSDIDPLAVAVTKAKLNPADLVEVALYLQDVNFNRPVPLDYYSEYFEPFFEVHTYRELLNLRSHLRGNPGRVADFVAFITLSILHGHSSGHLSSHTLPQISVTPDYQRKLNERRGRVPEYRAVGARILRKVSSVLRDGDLFLLKNSSERNKILPANANNLSYLRDSCVDLIVTSPPKPHEKSLRSEQWLRYWFLEPLLQNCSTQKDNDNSETFTADHWNELIEEFLFEAARVLKRNGRLAIELSDTIAAQKGYEPLELNKVVSEIAEAHYKRFFDVECLYINDSPHRPVTGSYDKTSFESSSEKVLVLRRK